MTSIINTSMGAREWLMLIVLSVLWGGSFFFVAVAVAEIPTLTIVTLRVGLAAVTLWVIALIMGLRPPKSIKIWLVFMAMGLLNNVIPFSLIVWGQTHIASGLASVLNATTPLFGVVVAGLLLADERATPMKLVGVVAGFMGVLVMIGMPNMDVSSQGATLGQMAILIAALSYAFAGVFGRRFKDMALSPVVIAAGQVTGSSLLLAPVALYIDGLPRFLGADAPSLGIWASILTLAVFSTALAYVLYFKILASAGATNIMLVTLLVPVSAILLGSIFLHEALEWVHFVGMGLIALGLAVIDGRLFTSVRNRKG
ncbi:MAG: DMT family transporter [Oceanospirillaceae bacterium]|nr:DMT family transporter [Oceanospirillaceae bacterium]MBT6077262.1 DMT family transporter [Oceanospirillaceae bacterium]